MSSERPTWIHLLDETPLSERSNVLQELVMEEFRRTLLFEPSESFPLDESFFALGLTSLGAVEIQERLDVAIGRRVDSTTIFNNPTINNLVDHIRTAVIPEWFSAKPSTEELASRDKELGKAHSRRVEVRDPEHHPAPTAETTSSRKALLTGILDDLYDS